MIRRRNNSHYMPWEVKRGNVGRRVKLAKLYLSRAGLYHGTIDGCFDADLERAVTKFQKAHGLYPNGVWNQLTKTKVLEYSDTVKHHKGAS